MPVCVCVCVCVCCAADFIDFMVFFYHTAKMVNQTFLLSLYLFLGIILFTSVLYLSVMYLNINTCIYFCVTVTERNIKGT